MSITHTTKTNVGGRLRTRVARHAYDFQPPLYLLTIFTGGDTGGVSTAVQHELSRTELESIGKAIADMLRDTEGVDVPGPIERACIEACAGTGQPVNMHTLAVAAGGVPRPHCSVCDARVASHTSHDGIKTAMAHAVTS